MRQQVSKSIGIVCVRKNNDNILEYFVVRKKFTYQFNEFVYGVYNPKKPETIVSLFDKMTGIEKECLARPCIYENMFKWVYSKNYINNAIYASYKARFEKTFPDRTILEKYLNQSTRNGELNWEFPKGHRKNSEDEWNAAIREFKEESGYEDGDFCIIPNAKKETSYRDGNTIWKQSFRIAYLVNREKMPNIDHSELCEAEWMPMAKLQHINSIMDITAVAKYAKKVIHNAKRRGLQLT